MDYLTELENATSTLSEPTRLAIVNAIRNEGTKTNVSLMVRSLYNITETIERTFKQSQYNNIWIHFKILEKAKVIERIPNNNERKVFFKATHLGKDALNRLGYDHTKNFNR